MCLTFSFLADVSEYGPNFILCQPWILENCPEVLSKKLRAELRGEVLEGADLEEVGL